MAIIGESLCKINSISSEEIKVWTLTTQPNYHLVIQQTEFLETN